MTPQEKDEMDQKEVKLTTILFFGPLALVTLPIWVPVLLAVKLFQKMLEWVL